MVSKHGADEAIALSESWPGPMLSRAKAARETWLSEHSVVGEPPVDACSTLMLGTDCAGAEAPVFALKGLKLPFQHQWAAEIAPHARAFITSSCALSPHRLLGDMCSRRHQNLDAINLYVCGFPCKPWSRLNNHSRYWDDPNAKPFQAGPTSSFVHFCVVSKDRALNPWIKSPGRRCWRPSRQSVPAFAFSRTLSGSCPSCRRSRVEWLWLFPSTTSFGHDSVRQVWVMQYEGPGYISWPFARMPVSSRTLLASAAWDAACFGASARTWSRPWETGCCPTLIAS